MSLTLDGTTLGEKHKHFNEMVKNAIDKKQINLTKINYNDTDIENLFKIDVASKTKNVEYIIEVLKCNDMLYISRAIKKSTWLITEQKYIHIINPDYLDKELFPYMLSKAKNKLLLHIRLHLKDENRVESFHNYVKNIDNRNDANKWLLNCSIPFIERNIEKEQHISFQLYKRLCKRSLKFLKFYTKVNEWNVLHRVIFLLNSNTEELLDFMAKEDTPPKLNQKKYTDIVMKKCPNRIIDNFENYIHSINFAVLAKYLEKERIMDFLFKYIKNNATKGYFGNYENLKHFIENMPEEHKFEFVKKTYIDKTQITLTSKVDAEIIEIPSCNIDIYRWYQFAPFNIAFDEIKKLIRAESSPIERISMLSILISCTRKHPQHINILLQHFFDKHRNEPFKFKIQFINNVIAQLPTHEFDSENWNILETLFHTLEVYIESDNEVQSCLQAIIVYKVVHEETIPGIVEKKLQFNTFKSIKNKLNEEQQTKLFAYLLNLIFIKIKNKTIKNESDVELVTSMIQNILCLIRDWNKNIENYPFILNKIREVIKVKKDNSWKIDLSSLYNASKAYRKYMFEESILLFPGEQVCLNALKHDPKLLLRYSDVVDLLKADDKISILRVLSKLRIYWPNSLAQDWAEQYMRQINMSTEPKSTIKGLFTLLPHNQTIDIAKKYAPKNFKINMKEMNLVEFSLQKNIAKHLHTVRPLMSLNVVLLYAKGDYLQFTIPSLNAISYNISRNESVDYITKLLHSPVSLQKYGLRLAFIKLNCNELKSIFSVTWINTMNATIRSRIFTYSYDILCKEKNPAAVIELWDLMSGFMKNMAIGKNKAILDKLSYPEKVPTSVQGQFYMKSYQYLTSLPYTAKCDNSIKRLLGQAPDIMDLLDDEFVVNILLSPIKEIISGPTYNYLDIISSYILFGKTEEEQIERFEKVLVPALEHIFMLWNTVKDNQYIMKEKIDTLLNSLTWDLRKLICFKKIVVPVKLFAAIKTFMEQRISLEENYIRHTTWSLTCEYVKLIAQYKDMFYETKIDKIIHMFQVPNIAEDTWETVHIKISPSMGSAIVKLLKNDTEKYFSTIYELFSTALEKFFRSLSFPKEYMMMETLKYMIMNEEFIPSYLIVCNLLQPYGGDEEEKKRKEISEILSAHPSLEVQMHYHKALDMIP